MNAPQATHCEHCNKSSLSLLLLRPSPVAKGGPLVPPGAQAVQDAGALASGLKPARAPTESRTVLRLLRAGFVHVYLPSPPPGMKPWLVYQVTDNGDLIAHTNPAFNPAQPPATCARKEHNKTGMRLLGLPQAHKLGTIWVAFSANLWSDTLKARNAANPKVMQPVNLAGGSPHTFKPTAAALQGQVLECALLRLTVNGAEEQDFPFASLAGQAESLAQTMERAAAAHPKTVGKEMAVVLADPVGYAAELNTLRLRRHELSRAELEKPANAHPLNSSNTLMGLKQSVFDANYAGSFIQVSPLKTKAAFEQSRANLPPGTQWIELPADERQALLKAASGDGAFSEWLLSPYKNAYSQPNLGRVVYPDHDARARAWAKAQTEKTWGPIATKVDEAKRAAWVTAFEARMKAEHATPLARFEEDWMAATLDAATRTYFDLHFDEQDPNAPNQSHCPGATYARESQFIHAPAPITGGPVLDLYLAMLDKPVNAKDAVVQRAIVANQASAFATMQAFVTALYQAATGDPGKDAADGGGMRDKAYDFMKGLAGANDNAALKKHAWLGDAIGTYSVHHLAALTAAATSAALRSTAAGPTAMKALARVQSLWGVQQALNLLVQGALSGSTPKLPIYVTMKVSVDQALAVLRANGQHGTGSHRAISRSYAQALRKSGGHLTLGVLTDTDALRSAQGDAKALLPAAQPGGVTMAGSGAKAAAGAAIVLSEEQFLALYARQSQAGSKAVQVVRSALKTQGALDVRAIVMGVDGRLAIGSIFVQGLGLYNSVNALASAKDAKEMRDAWYGINDSTAGVMGGLLEMWAVAVNSRVVAQAGTEVAARSLKLGALKFAANLAGAAGGAVNAVAAWAKADDAEANGDHQVSRLYVYSARAFLGTAATSSLIAASAGANTLLARGVQSAAMRQVLTRIGAAGTAEIIGISVSGWGLVLLGAGIVFSVGATVITPTPMQKWASRSYFGKGDEKDKFSKGDWKAEFDGLESALNASEAEGSASASKATTKLEPSAGTATFTAMGDLAGT